MTGTRRVLLSSPQQRLALGLGLLLLFVGSVINWRIRQVRGDDLGHVSYSILDNFDIYSASDSELAAAYRRYFGSDATTPWGIFDPPSSGVALIPLAFLPFQIGKGLYFVLSSLILLGGAYRLIQLFADGFNIGTRVLFLGRYFAVRAPAGAFSIFRGHRYFLGCLAFSYGS